MAYTTSSTKNYGQRLTGSIKGIAVGLLLFVAGTVMLFWNEGNFVKQRKALKEAQSVTVHVDDVSTVDGSLNGKLIHATALANTSDRLVDRQFGVGAVAVSLSRKVEFCQYEEVVSTKKKDKVGGGQETIKTYTYRKAWVPRPIESDKFNDPAYQKSNMTLAVIESETQFAENVAFDAYRLPPFLVRAIDGSEPLAFELSGERVQYWGKIISDKLKLRGVEVDGTTLVRQNDNKVYFGRSETDPDIGDVRITFTKIDPKEISLIAKVNNNTFEEFIAENGKSFYQVATGTVSASNMFDSAHSTNSIITWILRIIGILLVMIGLRMMFDILPTLFKVLPFLGNIIGAGVGLVCFVGGFAWSMLLISLSWLFYRPLIGIPLLLLTVAGIWLLKKRAKA